jgi:hypothetical protein
MHDDQMKEAANWGGLYDSISAFFFGGISAAIFGPIVVLS